MNWDAIGAFAEIGGAIAVLVTLIYLVRQIHLSNSIAIASSEIEIRNSFGQLNEAIFGDTDFAKLYTKARLPQAELDDVELVKLQAWLRQGLNIWMSIETAYNKGMTPRETYGIMFDDLKFIIDSIPAARPVLRELVEYYPALSETALFVAINDRLAKYQT
jgi:hypothetical protein